MYTETQRVLFKNVTLEITGDYCRGQLGTYEDPPEPSEFELETILLKGVDVTQLLEDYIEELELLTLQQIES